MLQKPEIEDEQEKGSDESDDEVDFETNKKGPSSTEIKPSVASKFLKAGDDEEDDDVSFLVFSSRDFQLQL